MIATPTGGVVGIKEKSVWYHAALKHDAAEVLWTSGLLKESVGGTEQSRWRRLHEEAKLLRHVHGSFERQMPILLQLHVVQHQARSDLANR